MSSNNCLISISRASANLPIVSNCSVDNEVMESGYVGNDKYKDLSATVGKGKKMVGYLFYEVPLDAKNIEIEYNADFWTEGNSIKFLLN